MITLTNKTYTADAIHLSHILGSTTKVNMLKVCKKFDLYVSHNLKKDETARRVAHEVIDNPIEIISRLSKAELQILNEFVKGDDSTYCCSQGTQDSLYPPKVLYGSYLL